MKSVGEAMSIGRTFKEAVEKAARSLEIGREGLVTLREKVDYRALAAQLRALRDGGAPFTRIPRLADGVPPADDAELREAILEVVQTPIADRMWHIVDGLRVGLTVAQLHAATHIDPWFLEQLRQLVEEERALAAEVAEHGANRPESLRRAKTLGLSDARIAGATGREVADVRAERLAAGIRPTFARVDSCAAEFEAKTPYLYSTWGDRCEAQPSDRQKVMILGGGPNRIGQGIEFDYCCVHAAFALRELGLETVMVNCNPETVSTDYDTSDRLYFEPLTFEDVMAIVEVEKPMGVIVQFGGQTPLKLAMALARAGVPILGTSAEAIDRAEDREKFDALPADARAASAARRRSRAVSVRPSRSPSASATRWSCGRATCSAVARWRSCTRARISRAT